MPFDTLRVAQAYQLGQNERIAAQKMQEDAETHDLTVKQKKLELDAAKLEQALHERALQAMQSGGPTGQATTSGFPSATTQPANIPPPEVTQPTAGPVQPGSIQELLMRGRQAAQPQIMPIPSGQATSMNTSVPTGTPPPGPDIPVQLSNGRTVTVPGTNLEMEQQRSLQQSLLAAQMEGLKQSAIEQAKAPFTFHELTPGAQGIIGAGTQSQKTVIGGKKPFVPEPQFNAATGGLESIKVNDPENPQIYHAGNIDLAPPQIQQIWNAIQGQQEKQRQLKETQDAKKEAEKMALQQNELNNALTKNDYRAALKVKTDADNDYQTALDRVTTMDKNAKAAKLGNQQAMLSLVANHIGMTLGGQKGARITQAVWNEAIASAPWLQTVIAKFSKDGLLSGVTLTPTQIDQMTELAHEKADTLLQHKQRVETEYHDALSAGTRAEKPNATPAPSGNVIRYDAQGNRIQ